MATSNSSGNPAGNPSGNPSGNPAGNPSGTSTLPNPKSPLRVSAVWTTVIYLVLGLLSAVFIWTGTPTPDSHARIWDFDVPSASGVDTRSPDTSPRNGLDAKNPTRTAGELYQDLSEHNLALFIDHTDALSAGLTVLDPTGTTPWLQEHRDELAPQPGKARAFLFENTYCAKQFELGKPCPYLPDTIEIAGTTASPISPRGHQFAVIPAAEDTLGYGSYLLGAPEAQAKEILPEVYESQWPEVKQHWFNLFLGEVLEYEGTYAVFPLVLALLFCIFIFAMEYRRNTNFPDPTGAPRSAQAFAFAHFPAHITAYICGIALGLLPLVWTSINQGNGPMLRAYLPNGAWVTLAIALVVIAIFTFLRFLIARHYLLRLELLSRAHNNPAPNNPTPSTTPTTTTPTKPTDPQGGVH